MVRTLILLSLLTTTIVSHMSAQETMRAQAGSGITIQPGAELTVQGDLVLANGSSLANNGSLRLTNYGSSGSGNLIDNSSVPYSFGTGRFIFNGIAHSLQSINHFPLLDINCTGSLTLLSNIETDQLYLSRGVITTAANTLTVINTASGALQADATNTNYINSWINGNLRRYVSPATVNSYEFPVGDNVKANPAVLSDLSTAPLTGINYLDVHFAPKPGTDAGLNASENSTPYTTVNTGGVWYITPDAAPGNGKYTLNLYFNQFTGLPNNAFGILARPDGSSSAADWTVPAGSTLPAANTPGRTIAGGFAQRINISSFSQFGIGQASSALPINLTGFTANRKDAGHVLLSWETSLESNNRGFQIQRKFDNENSFSPAGFVPSKAIGGNSSLVLTYDFNDTNYFEGTSFYRLNQIDNDGRATLSAIKAVKGAANTGFSIYPNPAADHINITIKNTVKQFDCLLIDAGGKTIAASVITGGKLTLQVSQLSAGEYFIYIPGGLGDKTPLVRSINISH